MLPVVLTHPRAGDPVVEKLILLIERDKSMSERPVLLTTSVVPPEIVDHHCGECASSLRQLGARENKWL
jgi:hypothetical protein